MPDYQEMDTILEKLRQLFKNLPLKMPQRNGAERTNSMITWFNSPLRGNQKVSTVVDMIQVGQWYGIHMKPDKKPGRRPAVKFREIQKDVLEKIQSNTKKSGTSEESDAESETDDDSDDDDDAVSGNTTVEAPREKEFKIDPDIDLASPSLLDLVSSEPVVEVSSLDKVPVSSLSDMDDLEDVDWAW
ncbi:uncharacterized protein EV420DRAFT_1577094 [Desarmillaria tabescens]|uniref:Uncharacterized protein n=1 Tax=Armillaria tabescens TaxID=1929756 RepID=A0AA39MQB2_ARMTA|nr:uncharacterized protein EV420DRAFT_1577094 [Desarmillaria tabescens]KAK0443131.1 hypothetical protein EV420DRAFT_1577094 [Desarmillaria tabescens]